MPYYAHIRQDENGETVYQTVAEHLTGTAALCREFAADFGAEADGDLMGLAHDLGKCTDAFQKRLLEGGPVVDHTTAGMLTCIKMKRPSAAACAAGHHGGLLDVGNLRTDRAGEATLSGRFKKGVEGHYLERCGESGVTLPTLPPETPERDPLKASFRTRMLYSCLVDADFLDTERFMDGERGRGGYDDLPTLLRRLKEYIAPWQEPKTALNRLRCKILNSCLDTGSKPKGIYTLTVPTGSGKTVASLAFALRHAVAHGMKRVIYVVPYTSIIEQNAEVFREILGDGNVLEHHSGVQFELSDGASPEEVRRALAAENWDMPVIVTTAVQFFESIYANRSSKCRKLHNLADSVIIFDEAQMLPLCHLRPCVAAMASLAEQFRSTLVLCTATQPSLGDLLHTYAPSCPVTELCPQTAEEYDSFRRMTFRQEGILEDDALAEKLSEHRQVLCIVNSRKAAQSIFARLPQEASFHLSTLMVPTQRQTLLDEIQRRLKAGEPCRVVSTSLIEAGVDVDFPVVYRELAGLDSVLQAAGRCNREGKRAPEESIVTVFERAELPPMLFRTAIGGLSDNDLRAALKRLANGLPCDDLGVDPNRPFYILGLAPNAARLSVRFFLRDSFGTLMENVNAHYARLEIAGAKYSILPLWALLNATVRDSKKQVPSPVVSGATVRAVFSGTPYPVSLMEAVLLRIRAERNVTWERAAILKAYLAKNYERGSDHSMFSEVTSVQLNEDCNYMPYLLGRLFRVMEEIQLASMGWSVNRSIRDSYFNSAASTPRSVFGKLFSLSNYHLKKLMRDKPGLGKKLGDLESDLAARLTTPPPARFSQEETICFYLGYYHQCNGKKEEKENV